MIAGSGGNLPAAGTAQALAARAAAVVGNSNFVVTGDLVVQLPESTERVEPPVTLQQAQSMLFARRDAPVSSRSRLRWLSAGAGIVRLQPRRDVDELVAWASSSSEPVVRLVTGSGGQGKTVLGSLICQRLAADEHVAGFVRLPPPGWRDEAAGRDAQRHWARILTATLAMSRLTDQSLLLIVDYAENHVDAVGELLSRIVNPPDGIERTPRMRILLLARHSRGWWHTLHAEHPEHAWVDPQPVELSPLADELDDESLADTWRDSVTAFAQREYAAEVELATRAAESVLAHEPRPPKTATTLDLYAMALLRVLDYRHVSDPETPIPQLLGDPLAGVLDHEAAMLSGLAAAATSALRRHRQQLGTPLRPLSLKQIRHAMAIAYFSTPRSLGEATRCLQRDAALSGIDDELAATLANLLAGVYPAHDGAVWSPLSADRLPDTHLLRTLTDATSDVDGIRFLEDLVNMPSADAGTLMAQFSRVITTPGGADHYSVGLARLKQGIQKIFLTHELGYLLAGVEIDPRAFEDAIVAAIVHRTVDDARRLDSHLNSLGFAATRTRISTSVSEILVQSWRDSTLSSPPPDPSTASVYAGDLNNLAARLAQDGRGREAYTCAQEAVSIYRVLSDGDKQYLPDLALSVRNLALLSPDAGRSDEALALLEESVAIGRRLVEGGTQRDLARVASSLTSLGSQLWQVGREQDAVQASREAVDIYRRLAKEDPDTYIPELALSLHNLCISVSNLGAEREALTFARESVMLYRHLAANNPSAYEPNFAVALRNLSLSLGAVGKEGESLDALQEAIAIQRALVAINPRAFLPEYARSIRSMGFRLKGLGREKEALQFSIDAIKTFRTLAAADPAYLPDLASALSNPGLSRLRRLGRMEALAPLQEAIEIWRSLAGKNPIYLSALAASLSDLSGAFWDIREPKRALAPALESAYIYDGLAKSNIAHLSDFAASLSAASKALALVGKMPEAITAARKASAFYRNLAEADPVIHLPNHAKILGNLALRLLQDEQDGALVLIEEAASIFRHLVEADHVIYSPDLAEALTTLGLALLREGRHGDALASAQEASEIYRVLVDSDPVSYLPKLAQCLGSIGRICLEGTCELERGVKASMDSVELFVSLAKTRPQVYTERVRPAAATLFLLLELTNRQDESEDVRRRFDLPQQ